MLLPNIIRSFACLFFVLALTSCGGGGGGDGGGVGGGGSDMATPQGRLRAAMVSGDSSVLRAEDASTIMNETYVNYQSVLTSQTDLIAAFYTGLSTKFDLIKDSFMVQPAFSTMEKVFPLVVGDKGNVLASISTVGGGRIAGYGYDILAGFDPNMNRQMGWSIAQSEETTARQTSHQPVFKRVLSWLVSGDTSRNFTGQDPASLNIAWSSLPTSNTLMYTASDKQKVNKPYAVDGLSALNIPFTPMHCDPLSAALKDCAAKAQLVVIGAVDRRLSSDVLKTQLSRLQEIIAAKIPVLYLNSHADGGAPNDYARATWPQDYLRLNAMGFGNGDTPDRRNYYVLDWVAADLTLDQLKNKNDPFGTALISRIKSENFSKTYDWLNCTADGNKCILPSGFDDDIVKPVKKIKALLDEINSKGKNLFDPQVGNKTLQQLVLWADTYRQSITYPIDKKKDPIKFQMAYIADSLVTYVRDKGSAQKNLGDFLDTSAKDMLVSDSFESINVTLNSESGFTSIGRFAVPGKAFQIRLVSPPDGSFKFKINTMSPDVTKQYESPLDSYGKDAPENGYRRPENLMSPEFPLTNQALSIVTPYGGTLQLVYSGTTAKTVSVQIKGAAKAPFYDTTQGQANASYFYQDMTSSKLGWMEIKTAGMEIHSIRSSAVTALLPPSNETTADRVKYPDYNKPYYRVADGILMDKYLFEAKKYVIEDAYRLAGLTTGGLDLNQRVKDFCQLNQWNCTDEAIHKPPGVQHFHIDIRSAAGSMSSGNPIHSGEGFNPRGWGESHELGHNLQKFNVYNGATGEVSNNIYPLHKKWRLLIELKREAVNYYNEMDDSAVVFDSLKATFKSSLTAQEKIAKAKNDIWLDSNSKSHLNRGMLYFYLQWPLIYAEVIKANSDMPEVDAIEAGWDIFTLMNLNRREVEASKNWATDKAKLGFSTYAQKPATSTDVVSNGVFIHHDYLLTVLSLITGRDQRPLFDFWGVETTSAGRSQVEAMGLRPQPVKFYAVRCSDDFRGFQAVDMTSANPVFPWPDEFKNLIDVTPVPPATTLSNTQNKSISTKQNTHTAACLAMR